jgi:para-aminobenzoate synthetase component I
VDFAQICLENIPLDFPSASHYVFPHCQSPTPMRKLSIKLSPQEVAERLKHLEGLVFIDSAGNFPSRSSPPISIVTAAPSRIVRGSLSQIDELEKLLAEQQSTCDLPFPAGGAFGWIDYDCNFCFGIYEQVLCYEHDSSQWWSLGNLDQLIVAPEPEPKPEPKPEFVHIGPFHSNFSRQDYLLRVRSIIDYIAAGDIYQVNLTQRFEASVDASNLFSLYCLLRKSSPAPMAAYLNLEQTEVLSSSPETFLKITGREVETRPIKGTRARFSDPKKDEVSTEDLKNSAKEHAELIMITDLERNDLGQICEFGSVKVPQLVELEMHEHVFHLVSSVTGTLQQNISHLQAIAACSPGGSITGAPKKRAREIIEEFETVPRGIYTGAIGYIGFNQRTQLNIAIRTLIKTGNTLHYHVGAGIVADSDPEHEYEETIQKAKGIRLALEWLKNSQHSSE